jgi:hypothetical protein
MAEFTVTATTFQIRVSAETDTVEEARELAAQFPKSAKVKATTLSTYVQDADRNPVPDPVTGRRYQHITKGYVAFYAKLEADNTNGGRNEAGIRRYRSFARAAARLGHSVRYDVKGYTNSLTADQFAEAVA